MERETKSEGRAASEEQKGEEQRGFRMAPWRARAGSRGVPAESAGAKRSWSAQLVRTGSSLSPAVPAAAGAPLGCVGTGGRAGGGRGKCEDPERRRGAALTFLAHAGAGCAELACRGTSGPRALTSRRARHPVPPGYARVWQPALVPPLSAAQKPMARRPLPRAGLPRPRGWPPGRAGERGCGDWAPGSPC